MNSIANQIAVVLDNNNENHIQRVHPYRRLGQLCCDRGARFSSYDGWRSRYDFGDGSAICCGNGRWDVAKVIG